MWIKHWQKFWLLREFILSITSLFLISSPADLIIEFAKLDFILFSISSDMFLL
ncbi:Uncharacterised protein [Salmonella enterica subsp. arizonae]|uniref:Uncharacterized protein n=1 Tax=Salmonella enterica subsp. arizonae TaxID=59203 RepID=A0A2X4TIP7_SALER|nr:Uncharacterised protein [Salmonella enterica subsp. arizonae]SUG18748.1 Uncharacterised protein [Salmonella enterica subsp. arizonae]SUG31766.1 Uncharacterised protein [Salmonella enterica subsp. arizonae]